MRLAFPRPVNLLLAASLIAVAPLGGALQASDPQAPPPPPTEADDACAPSSGVVSVRLVDVGTYRTREVGRGGQPDTLHGSGPVSDDLGLDQPGAHVLARLGTSMGFRYVAEGLPAGTSLPVRVVAHHPPMAFQGRTLSESSWDDVVWIGRRNRAGWRFETAYELVPGVWTLEVRQAGCRLVSQQFQVEVE